MPISTTTTNTSPSEATAPSIGERLKAWRRSIGVAQTDLATALEIDKGTLRKYELGLMAPGALVLARVHAHGVNINWVLTGEPPMMRPQRTTISSPDSTDVLLTVLVDTLRALRTVDHDKFNLLVRGFIARTDEARYLVDLEQRFPGPQPKSTATSLALKGNEDILSHGCQTDLPLSGIENPQPDPIDTGGNTPSRG